MTYMILENGEYAEGKFIPEGATVINIPRPTSAHSWNGSEWVFNGFSAEESMNALRFQRNIKLTETDWWCASDRTPTQAQLDYRTALRDLPSTASPSLDEDGQLTGVTWPTKPE